MFTKEDGYYEYERLKLPERPGKPRKTGLTVMIDMGPDEFGWIGENGLRDLLSYGAPFIDMAKIFATNALFYPPELIKRIMAVYAEHGVDTFAGGILFEIAYQQNAVDELVTHLGRLGMKYLEISENYLELTRDERLREIDRFQKAGIGVIYEFGRKQPTEAITLDQLGAIVDSVMEVGVHHVIVEQSELDMMVKVSPDAFKAIPDQPWYEHIVIEPDPFRFPEQHIQLIRDFGPDISLCNVAPSQVLRLEYLRRGIGRAVHYSFLSDQLNQKRD